MRVHGTVWQKAMYHLHIRWCGNLKSHMTVPISKCLVRLVSVYLWIRPGLAKFLRARAQIFDNFRKNSFSWPWKLWAAKWGLGVLQHWVQTGSEAHPASCPMGTGGPFPGSKRRPGRDADYLVPMSWMRSYRPTSSPPPLRLHGVLWDCFTFLHI
jgi:hypothetical protein